MIKAIETRYAGCNFRSRLEARWAVFFDSLGIEWKYEPEGFELESGRYLPDFFLPNVSEGVWFEIKPAQQEVPDPRWFDLVKETKRSLYVGTDIPRPDGDVFGWIEGFLYDDGRDFDPIPDDFTYVRDFWGVPAFCRCVGRFWIIDGYKNNHPTDNTAVYKAMESARSARFEHGQSGRT